MDPMKTPTKTPAARLLDAARAATPDAPTGFARSGSAVVTWYRASASPYYSVGTDAVCVARGRRSHVERYVEALLSGCVTSPDCERWIAARPAVSAAP